MEDRVASLEAYINNTDGTKTLPGVAWTRSQRLDDDLLGTGPLHDAAWSRALFYGGLVRRKNVLSVLAQCLGIAGLVSILWWAFGTAWSSAKDFNNPFFGGSEFFFFHGVTSAPNTDYAFWVSQNVYAMFQLMFAIITPALIVGAIAERMKFTAVICFITCWMFLVYFPDGAHGLGDHRFHERNLELQLDDQGDRLRGRHRGSHDLGLERARALSDSRSAHRLQKRAHASAQPGSVHDRHGDAVGWLVRI